MRRSFHALRTGKPGPVLVELTGTVHDADCGEYAYTPVKAIGMAPDPGDVSDLADVLLSAKNPVIHAGAGILYADATPELVELAELLQIPVLTTNTGKSGFPENHPLSLGAMATSGPKAAFQFLKESDVIFGAGTSLTRTTWGPQIPNGKRIVHLTNSHSDINKEHFSEAAMLCDAKQGLRALIDEIGNRKRPGADAVAGAVDAVKQSWRNEWNAELTSSEVPINQYRVLNDLMGAVDHANTMITHEAGSPREQFVTFWESIAPREYLGWGKSTQLGAGLGIIMGAKLAFPENLCINIMGDASIGMVGMDLETAARHHIGIITIVFNNGIMAGERLGLEIATERWDALDLGGNYAQLADALGTWSRRIEKPDEFLPAFTEAVEVTKTGRPVLIEVMAKENRKFSRY